MFIGFKNILQEKTRLAASAGALGAALVLILLLEGIFAGSEAQITAYIQDSPRADVWVMQKGVSNMHMASSNLAPHLQTVMKNTPGVQAVAKIIYLSTSIKLGGKNQFSYLVGYEDGKAGGPWKLAKGTADLRKDEAIIDEIAARKNGLGIGDRVTVLGKDFRIAGLSADTFSIANTYTFVRYKDLVELIKSPGKVTYYLVDAPKSPNETADNIERDFKVNALTKQQFLDSEKKVIKQMGVDLINMMAFVGFLIGVMIVGLTVYTLTLERAREFGIIKAVGASRMRLYRIVFEQSVLCIGLGLIAGMILAIIAKTAIESFMPELLIVYRDESVIKAVIALILTGLLASYMPIRRINSVDPMIVFKD